MKIAFAVIYAVLLCICSTVEFGSSYLVRDFKEMGDGAKATIQTSFEWLIEEYDPTTGMETLGTFTAQLEPTWPYFKQRFIRPEKIRLERAGGLSESD